MTRSDPSRPRRFVAALLLFPLALPLSLVLSGPVTAEKAPLTTTSSRPTLTRTDALYVAAPPVMSVTEAAVTSVTDVAPTPLPSPVPTAVPMKGTTPNGPSGPVGTIESWAQAAGIPVSEWPSVRFIVMKESGGNPNAINPSSGSCGLVQFLPCSVEKAGANWNDPVNALRRGDAYARSRYGGWPQAVAFWQRNAYW